jgi:hypothetical protein
MKNKWTAFMLAACILQTFTSVAPATAGSYGEVRREESKAAHSRHEARVAASEGHGLRATVHAHHAAKEQRRAWRHKY